MAFTLAERQALGIHGLIPPRFKTQEEQVELCLTNLKRYSEDLNKYIYLMGLQVQSADLIIFLFSPSRSIIQLL
jgi:malate dehydrogenase (oxaloacetate-decarboxylating)(NADP+)